MSACRGCRGRNRTAAAAFWNCINGNRLVLCKPCLDAWLDNADDDPSLEPESWGWLR